MNKASQDINAYTAMKEKIKANVLEVVPEAEVWPYGSRSRGDAREDSDWDVLVLSPQSALSIRDEGVFIDKVKEIIHCLYYNTTL